VYGLLVGSFFATSAYHFFPYFLVGYTSALVAMVEAKQETAAAEEVGEEVHGKYEPVLLAG